MGNSALIHTEMLQPEGFLPISLKFFGKKRPIDPRCVVHITQGAEDIENGAYLVINLVKKPRDGDRCLVKVNDRMLIMRVKKEKRSRWFYMPLQGSKAIKHPIIMKDLMCVVGKVEFVFNIPK